MYNVVNLIAYSRFLPIKDAVRLCRTSKKFRECTKIFFANIFRLKIMQYYMSCDNGIPMLKLDLIFSKFTGLKFLSIDSASIEQVPSLHCLESLRVYHPTNAALFKTINTPKLKVLFVDNPHLTGADLCEFINRCPELHCLAIKDISTNEMFAKCFLKLEKLYLGRCMPFIEPSIIRNTQNGLRQLVIGHDANMAFIQYINLCNVTVLVCTNQYINPTYMKSLISSCPRLEYLSISSTVLSFSEMVDACGKTLRKLKFNGMEITADQVRSLMKLQITHLSVRTEINRLRSDAQNALLEIASLKQCFVGKHQLSTVKFMESIGCDNDDMERACFPL